MSTWKFVSNGNGWWLRIEDAEQLTEYVEKINTRFGDSMMNVMSACNSGKYQHYTSQLDSYLEILYRTSGDSLVNTTQKLMFNLAKTYFDLMSEAGYVYINKHGGCNNFPIDNAVVVNRNECVFPDYNEKNIRIRTWKQEDQLRGEFKSNYKYHYYAYLGDMQITDGQKMKWDTYDEAYNFALKFVAEAEAKV